MPVITCPKCDSRYDPGMDEELEGIDSDKMSLKVVCPVCGQWLRLPENEPVEGPAVPAHILKTMMGQSRLIKRGGSAPSKKPSAGSSKANTSPTYTCPNCNASLRTANPIKAGRVVPCPKCKESFIPVPIEDEIIEDAPAKAVFKLADDPPPSKKPAKAVPKPAPAPEPPPAAKSRFDDDDDEDAESVRKGYGVQTESAEEIARVEANKPKFGEVKQKFAKSARGPAAAMLVQPANLLTAEGFATGVFGIGLFIYGMWPLVFSEAPPGDEETVEAISLMFGGIMVFVWGAIICVGASMMQNLQSYTMAMVGSVMGILPLFAGIYALTMLRNPKVIKGFEEIEVDDDEVPEDEEGDEDDDEDDEEDDDDDD